MNDKAMSFILLFGLVCGSLILLAYDLFGSRDLSDWDAQLIGKVCVDHQGVNRVEVTSKDMVIYCTDGLTYTNKLQK